MAKRSIEDYPLPSNIKNTQVNGETLSSSSKKKKIKNEDMKSATSSETKPIEYTHAFPNPINNNHLLEGYDRFILYKKNLTSEEHTISFDKKLGVMIKDTSNIKVEMWKPSTD